jgi:integrase/recombinase XerD
MVFAETGIGASELIDIHEGDVLETNLRINGKGKKQRYDSISPILKKNMIRYERMKEFYFEDKLVPHSNYFISYRGFPLTAEALQRVVIINCFRLERIGINN